MITRLSFPEFVWPEHGTAPARLRALIAYEDVAAGLAAWQKLHRIAAGLDAGAHHHVALWRLDMLEDRASCAQAVLDARTADIVLLALRGGHTMTAGTRAWLEGWLKAAEHATALGVLLEWAHRDTQIAQDILAYLRRATQEVPVEVFAGYFRDFVKAPSDVQTLPTPVGTRPPVFETSMEACPSARLWGINE